MQGTRTKDSENQTQRTCKIYILYGTYFVVSCCLAACYFLALLLSLSRYSLVSTDSIYVIIVFVIDYVYVLSLIGRFII